KSGVSSVVRIRYGKCRALRQVVGAHHLLGIHAPNQRLFIGARRPWGLLLLATMARHAAFASSFTRFLARPLVRCTFLMGRFPALACDLALLASVHRCKSTIFFCHVFLPAPRCANTR